MESVPVIVDIHHFGGLVMMRLCRMAVCWISKVDYDRYAIPRDIHKETARSAQSFGWVGLIDVFINALLTNESIRLYFSYVCII